MCLDRPPFFVGLRSLLFSVVALAGSPSDADWPLPQSEFSRTSCIDPSSNGSSSLKSSLESLKSLQSRLPLNMGDTIYSGPSAAPGEDISANPMTVGGLGDWKPRSCRGWWIWWTLSRKLLAGAVGNITLRVDRIGQNVSK